MGDDLCGDRSIFLKGNGLWSEWMTDYEVEPLSWMRLTAIHCGAVPIATVANRLAIGFAVLAVVNTQVVMELFEGDPAPDGKEVDWAFWVKRWHHGQHPPYDTLLLDLEHTVFASWGAKPIVSGRGKFSTLQEFLWFMLAAIRGWAERAESVAEVKPGCRWILKLHRGDRADMDPLAALLAYLYDRFQAGGYAPTKPLPARPEIEKSVMMRGMPRRLEGRPSYRPVHAF